MAHRINSLADYATKRFRLAGKAYLDEYDPFFVADRQRAGTRRRPHGRNFVSFANYDYLGSPAIRRSRPRRSARSKTLGVGALASRLVGGERSTHHLFEDKLADFLGVESVLTLVSRLSHQCDDHFAHHEHARRHLPR